MSQYPTHNFSAPGNTPVDLIEQFEELCQSADFSSPWQRRIAAVGMVVLATLLRFRSTPP